MEDPVPPGVLIELAGEAGAGQLLSLLRTNTCIESFLFIFDTKLNGTTFAVLKPHISRVPNIAIARYQGLADFAANLRPARNMR